MGTNLPSGSLPRKVVVHDGPYHADDVFCVAMLRVIDPGIKVKRTRASARFLEDPTILVADVGGDYNPLMRNFDHHQLIEQGELTSAFELMWPYFAQMAVHVVSTNWKYDKLFPPDFCPDTIKETDPITWDDAQKTIGVVEERLVKHITDWDQKKIKTGIPTVMGLISAMSTSMTPFEDAVDVAINQLRATITLEVIKHMRLRLLQKNPLITLNASTLLSPVRPWVYWPVPDHIRADRHKRVVWFNYLSGAWCWTTMPSPREAPSWGKLQKREISSLGLPDVPGQELGYVV